MPITDWVAVVEEEQLSRGLVFGVRVITSNLTFSSSSGSLTNLCFYQLHWNMQPVLFNQETTHPFCSPGSRQGFHLNFSSSHVWPFIWTTTHLLVFQLRWKLSNSTDNIRRNLQINIKVKNSVTKEQNTNFYTLNQVALLLSYELWYNTLKPIYYNNKISWKRYLVIVSAITTTITAIIVFVK